MNSKLQYGSTHGLWEHLQAPPTEALLTVLLNDRAACPAPLGLILDDYHTVDGPAIDQALTFLVEHLPLQLHLVLATREAPQFWFSAGYAPPPGILRFGEARV